MIEVFHPEDINVIPIISYPETPNKHLNFFMENLFKSIVLSLTTQVKDDWDISRFLARSSNFDSLLYSCDIESIYICILTDLAIEAITH